ncbi:hypothetical protein VST7929_01240 [Vibrio stylophorae]|uniref:DUF945 family protein n=1 Tax=Vibrio stylophorae TaxID=659351 RepID=A0ABN8DSZ3_9VIBR|nr:DUF945 family protein [Vibrio stylophorae]CAH0533374.1 hypothetical protein VST7929_01240 [Vibrio stylophorae]
MKKVVLPICILLVLLLVPLALGWLTKFKIEAEMDYHSATMSRTVDAYEMGYLSSNVVLKIEVTDYANRQSMIESNIPVVYFVNVNISHWQPTMKVQGHIHVADDGSLLSKVIGPSQKTLAFSASKDLLTGKLSPVRFDIAGMNYQDAMQILRVHPGHITMPSDWTSPNASKQMDCTWPGVQFSSPELELTLSDLLCRSQGQVDANGETIEIALKQVSIQSMEMLEPFLIDKIALQMHERHQSPYIDSTAKLSVAQMGIGEDVLNDIYLAMEMNDLNQGVIEVVSDSSLKGPALMGRLADFDPVFDMLEMSFGYTSSQGENQLSLRFSTLPGFVHNPMNNMIIDFTTQMSAADYQMWSQSIPQLLLLEKLNWLAWDHKKEKYMIESQFRQGELMVNRYPVSMQKMALVAQAMQSME